MILAILVMVSPTLLKLSGKISPCGFPADEARSFSRTPPLVVAGPKI
jgi:hypothetical protein